MFSIVVVCAFGYHHSTSRVWTVVDYLLAVWMGTPNSLELFSKDQLLCVATIVYAVWYFKRPPLVETDVIV